MLTIIGLRDQLIAAQNVPDASTNMTSPPDELSHHSILSYPQPVTGNVSRPSRTRRNVAATANMIDPAISPLVNTETGNSVEFTMPDVDDVQVGEEDTNSTTGKGKVKELSTTKRAAQNRAAQVSWYSFLNLECLFI